MRPDLSPGGNAGESVGVVTIYGASSAPRFPMQEKTTMLNKLMPDLDAAVTFLQLLRPAGPWNLVAIAPDNGKIRSASFTDSDAARAWIRRHGSDANIHFTRTRRPARLDTVVARERRTLIVLNICTAISTWTSC